MCVLSSVPHYRILCHIGVNWNIELNSKNKKKKQGTKIADLEIGKLKFLN